VAMDLYLTPTARLAHIVLPAACAFEKTELVANSGHFGAGQPAWHLMLRRQVLDPGERRSDWWFWSELAKRLGYGVHYPWADAEEAIDTQLRPLGLTVDDLKREPAGIYYGAGHRHRKYEQEGFATLSGKVELYSHVLGASGYDPLPGYQEPSESPTSAPDLAAQFPLVLTTGARLPAYTHSRHRDLPALRCLAPAPLAEMHPDTASKFAIGDGDRIAVETVRGRIELGARVTDKVLPGIVSVSHGWEEANVNLLTDHEHCDPVLGCPPLRSSLCRVRRS